MTYAKAIYAGVVAALFALGVVLVGDMSFADVTDGQWVTIVLAGLTTGGGTHQIRNRAQKKAPQP